MTFSNNTDLGRFASMKLLTKCHESPGEAAYARTAKDRSSHLSCGFVELVLMTMGHGRLGVSDRDHENRGVVH